LLTSKAKFQEDILKKELAQKEKARLKKRQSAIFAAGAIIVIIVSLGAAFYGTNEQKKAYKALEVAKIAEGKALKQKDNAKVAADSAMAASKRAIKEQVIAKENEEKARAATDKANKAQQEAKKNYEETLQANKDLDNERQKLAYSMETLARTVKSETDLRNKADTATLYQELLYKISSLRNKVQKQEFQDGEFDELLAEVQSDYLDYSKISFKNNKVILPNNDLYQVLLEMRKKLVDRDLIKGIDDELTSMSNGLRRIIVSPTGAIATGGDDGVLLYTKKALGLGPVVFAKFSLVRDRIRSMDFVNDKELVIGTVNGKLYLFNTVTGVNKLLEIGLDPSQIVEQVVASSKEVFVLVGGQVRKVPLSELSKTTASPKELPKTSAVPKDLIKTAAVPSLSVKYMFKINENKLLLVSKENNLYLLDMATLISDPIGGNLRKVAITSVISSGEKLFLGTESGDVIISKISMTGNQVNLNRQLTISAHKTRITSLAYDASSNKLFSASLDQTASIFDLELDKSRPEFIEKHFYKIEGFNKWIWDFALIQTGKVKTLLTVDESGKLKSWQTDAEVLYNEIFTAIKK
jgi:hypothetical protein